MLKPIVAASLVLVAGSAAAQTKASKDPNRVICRVEQTTGSRLQSERRCLTAQQWAELERETRLEVDRRRQQSGAGSTPQL
jgi:hypothetical protein